MEIEIKHTPIKPTVPVNNLEDANILLHACRLDVRYVKDILEAVLSDPRHEVLHDARLILDKLD